MPGRLLNVAILAIGLWIYAWGLFLRPATPHDIALHADASRDMAVRAGALLESGKPNDALPLLLKLHKDFPKNLIYIEQLARVWRRLNRWPEEAQMLETFIVNSPKPADVCPRIGIVYQKLHLKEQAMGAFERCVTFDPDDPDLMFHLGLTYERDQRTETAARLYRRGVEIDPQNADLVLGVGRMELRARNSAAALGMAERGLMLRPEDPDAMLVAGLALRGVGRYAEARTQLEHGLARRPNAEFHVALGILDQLEKHPDDAAKHYTEALRLDPKNTDAVGHLHKIKLAKR